MAAIQLKALWNAAFKDVDNVDTFLLGDNMIIQEDFIWKPDIIQEFIIIIINLLQKPLTHGYPLFYINLGQLVLDFDLVGIKFEIFNQNAPNWRYRGSTFLALLSQRSGWTLVNWLLNSCDILGCSDFYRTLRWCGMCYPTIFTSGMSFKVENLTSVWKCVEIKLLFVSYLNNLERDSFIFTQKISAPSSNTWFHLIWLNI